MGFVMILAGATAMYLDVLVGIDSSTSFAGINVSWLVKGLLFFVAGVGVVFNNWSKENKDVNWMWW